MIPVESHSLSLNASYVRLTPLPIAWSREVVPGLVVDYDKYGKVVGLERLGLHYLYPERKTNY